RSYDFVFIYNHLATRLDAMSSLKRRRLTAQKLTRRLRNLAASPLPCRTHRIAQVARSRSRHSHLDTLRASALRNCPRSGTRQDGTFRCRVSRRTQAGRCDTPSAILFTESSVAVAALGVAARLRYVTA